MDTEKSKKLVVFQFPNRLLWAMIITWFIGNFSTGYIHQTSRALFITAGIIWAYEEIVHGDSWFRKILGAAVMIMLFYGMVRG